MARALATCALLAGCTAGNGSPGGGVEVRQGAISGGDSRDVTTLTTLPARGVGWIDVANHGDGNSDAVCTATPILRDVLVTAGHCLCLSVGKTAVFHLPHPNGSGGMVDVGPAGQGITSLTIASTDFMTDVCADTIHDPASSARDIGVVRLSSALNTTDLPEVMKVYTKADFLGRRANRPGDAIFFQGPIEAIGYALTNNRKIATVNDLKIDKTAIFTWDRVGVGLGLGLLCTGDFLCSNEAKGFYIHDSIDVAQTPNRLILVTGDSGGPIVFRQNGGAPTVFGVSSVSHNTSNDSFPIFNVFLTTNAWSPTWDNGTGNGTFLEKFLPDADGDGVSDSIDNCTAPRCNSQATCVNPDQTDADGDHIGDTCDNCPGSLCVSLGSTALACANPAQEDRGDQDGIGDVCDICPGVAGGSSGIDGDHDQIGDACDICPFNAGGRKACHTDGDCLGRGFCIVQDVGAGRCNDGTNHACGVFLGGGPCASCVEMGTWGVCSGSDEPDTDGDGIGNRCDTCPLVDDYKLQIDSNRTAEDRERVAAFNDACDTVPMFTSSPIAEPMPSGGFMPARALFTAFAGVGSDTAVPHAPFTSAPVGFRHCDCSPNVNPDVCLMACGTLSPQAFDNPNDPSWKQITVGASPAGSYDQTQISTPALNFQLNPIYTAGIDCSDPGPHQGLGANIDGNDKSLCHLGLGTGRLLSWATDVDINAGRVASFSSPPAPISGETPLVPDIVRQTAGIFWSHGISPTPFVSAGARDTASAGRLRDNYAYVKTPVISFDVANLPRVVATASKSCPTDPQCEKIFSRDWLADLINPGAGINVLRLTTRPFILYTSCASSTFLCAIRRSTDPHIDLGLALTANAQGDLADGTRFLLSPIERRTANLAEQAVNWAAVSIPRSWSQLNSTVRVLGTQSEGTQIDVMKTMKTASASNPPGTTAFGGAGFVPSDRTGARSVFSEAELNLYMVGGTAGGRPTGEIWRLDLSAATWTQLFGPSTGSQLRPTNVAAVGYDSGQGKLLVADALFGSTTQTARLLVFDTHARVSRVAATLNLGGFTKTSLTGTGGGVFILTGAAATGGWIAYRFQITAANGIGWLGKTSGTGLMVGDPIAWQEGPGLFVQRGSDFDATDLAVGTFTPSTTAPPELGVCAQPLVIGTLPAVTLSSCHTGSLTPPTPQSACGPVSFTTDAPDPLPLGTTTVHWTFKDALGNTATASQSVTSNVGDSPDCCPAGMNVIIGTSNNDTLTGTSGPDCIIGLGGQDTLNGGGGDDFLSGGDGNDTLNGGAGHDRLFGGTGQDILNGNDGNDTLNGGDGDDRCFGGTGNDTISGGENNDTLNGEAGADTINGDNGDDTLSGGTENDTLDGGSGRDSCSGGSGTNQVLRCESSF